MDRTPYIPLLLFITTFIPSIPLPYDQTPALQNLHRRLRASTVELHGRRSMFEDPARDRAFVAADPSLQDPGSNLTFTFFVNGFWSKE